MKTTSHFKHLLLFIPLVVLFSACRSSAVDEQPLVAVDEKSPQIQSQADIEKLETAEGKQESTSNSWIEGVTQIDEQGAVVVEIIPLNLNDSGQSLDFQVSLNTHSVDLSMDLAALATLETDTGYTVRAIAWDAPRGGHHVSGILKFPSDLDGSHLLEGASRLFIRMTDVDADERVFTWER